MFVSIVGYARGTWASAQPFVDPNFGADGIFLGAAALFFTYVRPVCLLAGRLAGAWSWAPPRSPLACTHVRPPALGSRLLGGGRSLAGCGRVLLLPGC